MIIGVDAQLPPQAAVGQVGGADVLERRQDAGADVRDPLLEVGDERLDLGPPRPVLIAAQVAGDDREPLASGEDREVGLGAGAEGADHRVPPVVAAEDRGHRLELAGEEQVEEERLDDVLPVMSQGDLGATELLGRAVEDPPAEPGAEAAVGLVRRDLLGHDRVGVLGQHVELSPASLEPAPERLAVVAGLLLVEVDRDEREFDRGVAAQLVEEDEEGAGVLASRDGDQDPLAGLDHAELDHDLADGPLQAAASRAVAPVGRGRSGVGCRERQCVHGIRLTRVSHEFAPRSRVSEGTCGANS
jgi:hypothetical protein